MGIKEIFGTIWEGLKLLGGVFVNKNTDAEKANAAAKTQAEITAKVTKDVAAQNDAEIEKDIS